jgi:hypothetical protein
MWLPAYETLARRGKDAGCAAILTGSGGDEWLTVSPYYAADLIRGLDVRGLARLYSDHRRSHNVSTFLYLKNILWRFGIRQLLLESATGALGRLSPATLDRVMLGRVAKRMPPWLAPDPSLRRAVDERELRARSADRDDHRWIRQRSRSEHRALGGSHRLQLGSHGRSSRVERAARWH